MDPIALLGTVVGVVERYVTRRQRIVLRSDSAQRALASFYPFDERSTAYSRIALVKVYNGGPGRVTINAAGWEAKDGTRIEAHLPVETTLEPGSKELEATADATRVAQAHAEHGGIVRAYVELAGDTKPRREKVPKDWISNVEALAARERRR